MDKEQKPSEGLSMMDQAELTDALRESTEKSLEALDRAGRNGPMSKLAVSELTLSASTFAALCGLGIRTAGDLMSMTDGALRRGGLTDQQIEQTRDAVRRFAEGR